MLFLASRSASGVRYGRPYSVMRCMRDMCAALNHIHSYGILHRDVSCRNILVDSDGRMLLADLGLAVELTASNEAAQHPAVPVRWTSPEALASARYSSQSDVWSLGVAVWEMTAGGRLPYDKQRNTKACIRLIVGGQHSLQVDATWGTESCTSEAELRLAGRVRAVLQQCLTFDVEQRPDSEQLKQIVEREWEEWKVEAGDAADSLESDWEAHHSDVQKQLGPPAEHGPLVS